MIICDICFKEFETQGAINGHMRIHSGIQMKKHDTIHCNICHRDVSIIWIKKHILNHKKSNCLQCGKGIYDKKFCNYICSAIYTNKNRKYSAKLDKRTKKSNCNKCGIEMNVNIWISHKYVMCEKCKFEIKKLKLPYKISDETRRKLSVARIKSIKNGNTNFKSKKCEYIFNGKIIKCDSKIEYSCLDYFEKNFDVIDVDRCDFEIKYIMNKKEKLFLPDFKISTLTEQYIVECKSDTLSKSLNKKWHFYKESAKLKKVVLENYCNKNNLTPFWYTKSLNRKFYNSLKF
jgi:hypothetical protein